MLLSFGLTNIIDLSVAICIWLLAYLFIRRLIRASMYLIISGTLLVLISLAVYFDLKVATIALLLISIALVVGICGMCQSELHKFLNSGGIASKILKKHSAKLLAKDENLLFTELKKSILQLSEERTGAIIVIERDVNLQSYIDDGISVHAPVKAEVLNSIFYEGTPLHDGALIIRGSTIEAAHVFVTPTTRALLGHYGARHRAAVGISEVTDALIIVVSEETGRISFVERGELETITREKFTQALSDKLANL